MSFPWSSIDLTCRWRGRLEAVRKAAVNGSGRQCKKAVVRAVEGARQAEKKAVQVSAECQGKAVNAAGQSRKESTLPAASTGARSAGRPGRSR